MYVSVVVIYMNRARVAVPAWVMIPVPRRYPRSVVMSANVLEYAGA